MKLEIVPGKKGPYDRLVLVWAYGEPLSVSNILTILDKYFRSEEGYYPKPQFEGSTMLLKAIVEIYSRIPLETVLKKYKLDRKIRKTIVIERVGKPVDKLSEFWNDSEGKTAHSSISEKASSH